ncbi:unnamed protein product [Tetraodon nigroviridis]|uniref:(spotted green pufferfish) hypothetical protein n=1 Tax=Tetraodon nigroviridis TaxID=99883 RepID=Q4RD86_TETNG|nr:unnamed protein product [Tetraodon nigroviridis]
MNSLNINWTLMIPQDAEWLFGVTQKETSCKNNATSEEIRSRTTKAVKSGIIPLVKSASVCGVSYSLGLRLHRGRLIPLGAAFQHVRLPQTAKLGAGSGVSLAAGPTRLARGYRPHRRKTDRAALV